MKNIIITTATVLFIGFSAVAQNDFLSDVTAVKPDSLSNFYYNVQGRYERPVLKERLVKAKLVSDLFNGYPTNWIDEYVSVEILTICDGKAMSAVSLNEKLTKEQKNNLKSADLASDININVKYKSKNPATNDLVDQQMNVAVSVINISMTLIPESEAEFAGGQKQLKVYLKENIISKIPSTIAKRIIAAEVQFTVNEEGKTVNTKISKTSGDAATDQLMMDAINKMPNWKPAENAKGIKVKQDFKFTVGNAGC